MCDKYPNCKHLGPVVEEREHLPRHCNTLARNTDCPYIQLGCLGCRYKMASFLAPDVSQILPALDRVRNMSRSDLQTLSREARELSARLRASTSET